MSEGAGDNSGPATGVKLDETPVNASARKATVGELVTELKRRRVFRVMAGYGIFAFTVLQIIEPIMHGAHMPDWVLTAMLVALAVGFPVALIMAWLFDLTAQGVIRTPSAAGAGGIYFSRRRLAALLFVVGLLGALPGVAWYLWKQSGERGQAASVGVPSIAVLPFADMSPQHDQEYFSDGMAEEILNALAQVDGLMVIGRTSSFSFKGKNEDLRNIGQKLGVGTLLEGSVRKENSRVRITAQLVRATDGSHLWSQTFDRDLSGVFAIQEEIARAVVAALQVRLLPNRGPTTRAAQTSNQEAYSLVLRARHVGSALTKDGYLREHTLAEQAAALDPSYAMPHAMMGLTLRMMTSFVKTEAEATGLWKRALAEAERAVQLGPELDEAYSIRALLRTGFQHDWTGAEADLSKALALSPSHPASLRRLGLLRAELGRLDDGIALVERSARLDPLRAETWNWLGTLQAAGGKSAEARASLTRSLELAPASPEPRYNLALLEIQEGRPAAALALVPELNDDDGLQVTALVEHDLGHEERAKLALDQLIARHGHEYGQGVAEVYAWRGDLDPAFEWLDRTVGQESYGLKWAPLLQKLRSDPRYTALLKKMNLPVD